MLTLSLLIGLPILVLVLVALGLALRAFIRRARERKALRGAALWLTGTMLTAIFLFIGFMWGNLKSVTSEPKRVGCVTHTLEEMKAQQEEMEVQPVIPSVEATTPEKLHYCQNPPPLPVVKPINPPITLRERVDSYPPKRSKELH